TILPDAGGNRLIVVADKPELDIVEELVKKLDKVSAQSSTARVFKLKSAEPEKVAEILTASLVRYDAYGRPQRRATVSVDSKTRTLIVTGDPKELQGVSVIIEQLDTSLGAQPDRKMKVVSLKQGRVVETTSRVRQLYADHVKTQPELASSELLILDEPASSQIILSGTEAQLTLAEKIIEDLQVSQVRQSSRETRMIEMGTVDELNRVLPMVQQLYQDRWRNRDASDPADAAFLTDSRNARLIITARTNQLSEIEAILGQVRAGQSATLERDTRIFDLTTASAAELSTTVRTLYLEQSKNRPGSGASETIILPDSGSNRLIITGSTNELAVVEEIIRKLDKVSAQSATTRVFKLKAADPDKIVEILGSALVRYDAYGRPQKRVSVVVDSKTRTLIATGDPKELQSASVIIEQLDSSLGTQPERRMRVMAVKAGRAAELLTKIRQVYLDQARTLPELGNVEPMILEDSASNQLILGGTDAQLTLLDKIAGELQTTAVSQQPRETKLLEIGSAEEIQRVQSLVQQLYQDRWKTKEAGDPADATFIADAKSGKLIVTGRASHLREIEQLLSQISTSSTNDVARDTRVYELESSSAAELATTVRSLYQEQLKSRPAPMAERANVLPDAASNRLIVSGSSNELTQVESIIMKLDKASAKTGGTRVFTLTNAEAEQVSSVLSAALVTLTPYGVRVPRVSVGADPINNLVIVAGEPKDIQSAAVVIEQMDGIAAKEQRTMRIIPLKSGTASAVSGRVKRLFEDQTKGRPKAGAEPLILGDDASNRLLITGNDSQLKLIDEIVSKLQEAGEGAGRQLRVLLLERNSAAAVAALVTQIYSRQTASTEEGERLLITPGGDDQTLVIDAAGTTLSRVEELVRTLDKSEAGSKTAIQAVHLKKGKAEELAEAVNKSIASRNPAGRIQKVNVTAVAGANSLLINGPSDAVPDVLKLIQELDTESEGTEVEVRIYKLENGSPREVQGVLNQLLRNVTLQRRQSDSARVPMPSLSVDERSNSLIVSGTPAHFRLLEKLLPTLDKAPERADRDVQFVWLRKAKAFDVALKIESVFSSRDEKERPLVEADGQNNSITIIARRGDMAQVQDLISRLDDFSKDSNQQVRLRPLERVSAQQMASMLQNIYPQMSGGAVKVLEKVDPPKTDGPALPVLPSALDLIGPPPPPTTSQATNTPPEVVIAVDKIANALVLSGPASELDRLDRIISDLSFNFYGNEAEFRLFALREADPIVAARALSELLKEEPVVVEDSSGRGARTERRQPYITVVADPRTRSLIVRARPTDFALVESVIKQLDAGGLDSFAEFRMIRLTNAPPERVQPLVQQMVTQLNLTKPGEPMTITADARSGSLLVMARSNIISQLERMVSALDGPSNYAEAEVLVIPVRKANALQLAASLQAMLRPGTAGEWGPEARELQEQVRRLKVVGASGEVVSLDLSKPIKVAAEGGSGNRLILTSTPDNLKALAAVAGVLDNPAIIEGVEVRIVPLKHADASAVSQTLSTIFTQGRTLASGPGGLGAQPEGNPGKALVNPLTVASDTRSNSLILSGQKESIELALKVISDMDQQIDRFITEVRLFRMKHASATRILPALQAVFAEGPAVPGSEGLSTQITRMRTLKEGSQPQLTETSKARAALVMQADDLSNILIVAARSDMLPLIGDVIDQLDIPAASGLETVRIYPLTHADPTSLQRILNDLYTGPRATNLRNEDKPVITIDVRTSSLIVAGNGKSFAVLEGLLQQLDAKLPFELRDIRVIPLENADVQGVAPTLQRLMDARVTQRASLNQGEADTLKVTILSDSRSNSLLVSGSRNAFEMVESLARQLDKAGPALSGQIRLIPLAHADPRVMASTLDSLFDQRYDAARSSDVQRTKPIILPDPRSNSLLVSANQEDNRTIDDLLKRLDAKMENPSLTLTVIPLKNNDSARVAPMIESIFTARQRAQTLPGQTPLPSDA
ncbi:MAG: hypothetical protein FJ405_09765, partial [Verrucomicrobia bacterium]|nr:hypothetical protein [Verrucomicrobiota bacterium]